MTVKNGVSDDMAHIVQKCEHYADSEFSEEAYFTQLTKWQDGDFRVMVWHGKGHEQQPYRQAYEKIEYVHQGDDGGKIRYVAGVRRIDAHLNDIDETRILEVIE